MARRPQLPRRATRPVRVCVGCSGWNYKSWRQTFYPANLPARRWLQFYAEHFQTVEINNSFYRLPEKSVFAGWRREVPTPFVFAVKASRYLTHMKRLRDPEEPIERLFARARALGPKLGPVLYQLPATFHADVDRLTAFLIALPKGVQHVFEFRHPSWYTDATFACLEAHGAALCLHDKSGSPISDPLVGPFVYVRFHGTSGNYHGGYSAQALRPWARRLADAARSGRDVYAYFNNDPNAEAVRNAGVLGSQLDRQLANGER